MKQPIIKASLAALMGVGLATMAANTVFAAGRKCKTQQTVMALKAIKDLYYNLTPAPARSSRRPITE